MKIILFIMSILFLIPIVLFCEQNNREKKYEILQRVFYFIENNYNDKRVLSCSDNLNIDDYLFEKYTIDDFKFKDDLIISKNRSYLTQYKDFWYGTILFYNGTCGNKMIMNSIRCHNCGYSFIIDDYSGEILIHQKY